MWRGQPDTLEDWVLVSESTHTLGKGRGSCPADPKTGYSPASARLLVPWRWGMGLKGSGRVYVLISNHFKMGLPFAERTCLCPGHDFFSAQLQGAMIPDHPCPVLL